MIPIGWHKATIGDLCEFINGNGFKPVEWSDKGLPIIRIQNMNGSKDFNYYPGAVKKQWLVEPGQLLFAWAGTKGVSFGPKIWPGPTGVLNQHIYKLDIKANLDKRWLFMALVKVTERIESQAHGFKATLLHVQKSDITDQVLMVPSLPEQKEIADIISTWEDEIKRTEQLLNNSQLRKKCLTQRLLSGKVRFKKFVKSMDIYPTRYGTLPKDWGFVPMGEVAKQILMKNSDGKEYPVLSCSKHDGFVDSLKYFNKKVYSDDTSNYNVVERGFFAFPSNHIEEGSIGYQNIYDAGIVSPIYVVFKTDKTKIDNEYLYKLLKTEHYRQIFSAATNASVDRRGSLRWKEFSKIRIPLPSLEEQRRIAEVLMLSDREIECINLQLDRLRLEKKSLMHQLLTGKRRVKSGE